jgi:Ca-activated chloride channel family protein
MNHQSFERQMQQIDAPPPRPAARLQARHAAVAEFERIQGRQKPQRASRWVMPRFMVGGFATACVAIVGVSIVWLMPEEERAIGSQAERVAYPIKLELPAELQADAPAVLPESPSVASRTTAGPARNALPEPAPISMELAQVQVPPVLVDIPNPPVPAPTVIIAETTTQPVPPAPPAPDASAAAFRKSANQELNEVQVGGTRIQAGGNAAAPLTSITGEEMRRLGIANVADALTQLVPQNMSTYQPGVADSQAAAPPAGGSADRSQFFIGNTIANLRGMDPAFGGRTLTLIDGRRVSSTSNQADVVDLNIIPSNLLQGMDVVTGGASANDRFAQFEVNPVKRTVDEPESTFSADVDTASYSFVRRQLNSGVRPAPNAVRTEEMLNYFNYSWPAAESRTQPFKPTVTVSDSPWNKGRKLIHIGIKGYEMPARQRPDVNLVLLLDVSGSMDAPDRLPLAQRSVELLLGSLKPTDTVGIAVYAGRAGEVLPPTPVREKDAILRALYSLQPGGSTAGAAGIQLAYEMAARNLRKGGVNRILLATDGDFNVGIRDPNQLKDFVQRQRENGVSLSVLGFGQGNYRDEMAQVLAQNGNGVAAYIDSLSEARKVLVDQANAQLFTIAKDVKLQVEFNPATVAEYRLVGYETRALVRQDFNNDKVDAGDVGAGHTVTAIYEITPADAASRLIDQRRYGADEKPAVPPRGNTSEYGYLKIRYKLPDGTTSQLIEQPIAVRAGVPAAVRRDVQFSTAVAGFAQLLQGGRYTGSLNYDDVYSAAEDALGRESNGDRAEFLQLVRKAQGTLRAQ